ncbi:MAG: SPOR domain-containing protein [Pseudomonadota bacterium]
MRLTLGSRPVRFSGPAAGVAPFLLASLFLAPGCMEAAGTGTAASTTTSGAETTTPAALPGTAALPASFTGPPLVDPALYAEPLEGPIFSGLEPRPDIFETRDTVRWRGQQTLAGIWIAHPAAPPAIRARFINPDNGRGADGALVRRAGAEAPLISSEAAEALQIRPFRDVEVVIVAVDLPTVIAVGEPGDPQTLSDASIEDGTDPLATPEIGDVVANAQLETATESLAGDEAAGRDDIVVAQSTTEEPAFLSEAEDAIDELQGPVVEAEPTKETDEGDDEGWQWAEETDDTVAEEATDDLEQNRVIKIDGPAAPIEAPDTAPVVTQSPSPGASEPEPAEEPSPEPERAAEPEPAPAREPEPEPEPETEPEPAPSTAAAPAEAAEEPTPEPEPAPEPVEPETTEPPALVETPAPAPEAEAPAPDAEESALARPFVQAGVFSVEGNAQRVVATLRSAGHGGRISNVTLQSGPAFRVVAGPFTSRADRQDAIRVLRNLGIADAAPTRR